MYHPHLQGSVFIKDDYEVIHGSMYYPHLQGSVFIKDKCQVI